jgi:hypothetical protein
LVVGFLGLACGDDQPPLFGWTFHGASEDGGGVSLLQLILPLLMLPGFWLDWTVMDLVSGVRLVFMQTSNLCRTKEKIRVGVGGIDCGNVK